MTEALIDQIYEAAFVPDLWPDVLAGLSQQSGGDGGAIVVFDHTRALSRQTSALAEMMEEYCAPDQFRRSSVVSYLLKRPPATFVYDDDYLPPAVRRGDNVVSQCAARGKGSAISTMVSMPTPDDAILVLERSRDAGRPDPVVMTNLNGLRPHLARALLLSARLCLDQARNTVETLSRLGLPAAVLTGSGNVIAANDGFASRPDLFRIGAFDRLSINHAGANTLFQDAVAGIGARSPAVKSIPLLDRDADASMIVHVAPIVRSAHDIFDRAECIVIATPVGAVGIPDGAMLHGLFDLSPAEARLVQQLASGMTLSDISIDQTLSIATLRTQLRSVFAKTGTSRQVELAQLVGTIDRVFVASQNFL